MQKHNSSSSEDDIMEISGEEYDKIQPISYVSELPNTSMSKVGVNDDHQRQQPQLHCSRDSPQYDHREMADEQEQDNGCFRQSPEDKAQQIVRDAEASKARIFNRPGEDLIASDLGGTTTFVNIAQIDQDYLLVGNHVEVTQSKIIRGEYIDFGKLLPKDKVLVEEDGRMELIMKNGKTFWSPVSESIAINSYIKWEQAFRIFSDIYTRAHPHKST